MVDLTLTLVATGGTIDHTKTGSAETETRYLDWIWYSYPQYDVTDPENPVPKPDTPANRADAWREWAAVTLDSTWQNVKRWEQLEAARDAAGNVGDLD
jgi:hypothetical protein